MSKQGKYRILIVADHPMVRDWFKRLLEAEPDLEVCGEAEGASQAWTAVEAAKPDLVIVDLSLPDAHGLDLIKGLHARYPQLLMLVVSMYDEQVWAEHCLRAGARGYLEKCQVAAEILQAIRQVLAGELCFSRRLLTCLAGRTVGEKTADAGPLADLTDRELQVFTLLGQGLETKEIAAALHLDSSTVETHRRHIKQKWGLPTTTAVLRSAVIWNGTAELRLALFPPGAERNNQAAPVSAPAPAPTV